MPLPKLSELELKIMEALWTKGPSCVRDIRKNVSRKGQTGLYHRMEVKGPLPVG